MQHAVLLVYTYVSISSASHCIYNHCKLIAFLLCSQICFAIPDNSFFVMQLEQINNLYAEMDVCYVFLHQIA